jgi:endonuclease/exonuclease/phosphatase family metal-dependent hydrolase
MSQRLKLIQYNIWESKHVSDVEAFLKEQDADIVTLQEATCGEYYEGDTPDAFMQLKSSLKLHGVYAPTVLKKKNGLQGNAILSKHPIVSHEVTFLNNELAYEDEYDGDITKEPRAALKAEINISGLRLQVITTHLTFSPYFNPSDLQLSQARNLLEVLRKVKNDPLIFAGDLNTKQESKIISLFEENFSNALHGKDFKTFAKRPFSFEGFEVKDLEYLLDYIFVNDLIRVIDVNAKDVDGSDHLPVVAMIEVGI